jgi:Arc/MetJ-type ribon-helix-helix transcriptional regulator
MVLEWFSRTKQASVDDLVARKSYGKAIELIRAALQKRRKDRRLRLQLVDVLSMAGKNKEAVEILSSLADDLALAGFAAQAIAVLKRMQSLTPGQPAIEEKLAYMITQQSRPAPDPWAVRRDAPPRPPQPEFGMEALSDDELGGDELGVEASPGPEAAAEPSTGELGIPDESPEGDAEEFDLSPEGARDELASLIEDVFAPTAAGEAAAGASLEDLVPNASPVQTPLFQGFSNEELVAVIRGLRLLTFAPGMIVVSEGQPGDSLFVLATGMARAFVKTPGGRNIQVRELMEGDFFGEISILTGKPRTATITAASRCELLELDRATLDAIAATHPHVNEVLKEFHDQRAGNTLEAAIRGMGKTPG